MSNGEISNFYEHGPASGNTPQQVVLLLHGLGSNGQDLISLAPFFARALPDAMFVSPDAPFHCDMAPFGYQWFSLQDWSHESMLKGIQTAMPILQDFMDEQRERFDLPADKLALVGFSQGTMMSLYAAPRYTQKIAGVLGYSGALVWEENAAPAAFHKPDVRLIHGEADPVVPIAAYHHAKETLENAGFNVTGHTTPGLMHSIDEQGIASGSAFLKQQLA